MAQKLTPLSSKYAKRRNRLWITAGLFGIVVTGLVGAVVASKMQFDLRNQAAGKNKANAKLKNEVCGLDFKSEFENADVVKRDWMGYDLTGAATSNVTNPKGMLKLDTTMAGDTSAFVGVRANRGASTKFTASIKLDDLTMTAGSGATGDAGTLRYGLVTELSNAGLSGNFVEVKILADSRKMARVMTMVNGVENSGSTLVELPLVTSEEDIILTLKRDGVALSANFKSKKKTDPVALGSITALAGSGSYDVVLTANPKHQLVATVDNFNSSVCHYTCKGAGSQGLLKESLDSKWYKTTTGGSTVSTEGEYVMMTAKPEADPKKGDYRATLTNRQIFRGPFDSQIRVDLKESDIKKNSGVNLQFANLNGTRKAMIWVEQGQDEKFYISGAMFDGKEFKNPNKTEKIGKESTVLLSIQRWDSDVRLRYKENGKGEWKTLHTFKNFYGGVGQMSVFMNTTPNELATARAAIRNFGLDCTEPIFKPAPVTGGGGGTSPVDPGTAVDPGSEGSGTGGGGASGGGSGSTCTPELKNQQTTSSQELKRIAETKKAAQIGAATKEKDDKVKQIADLLRIHIESLDRIYKAPLTPTQVFEKQKRINDGMATAAENKKVAETAAALKIAGIETSYAMEINNINNQFPCD